MRRNALHKTCQRITDVSQQHAQSPLLLSCITLVCPTFFVFHVLLLCTAYARCIGPLKPPAQPWQNEVPATTPQQSAIDDAKTRLSDWMSTQSRRDSLIWLAAQCAGTFRVTDYRGGCNGMQTVSSLSCVPGAKEPRHSFICSIIGARIRFSPEKNLAINLQGSTNRLDAPLAQLNTIQSELSSSVSMSDLIVLAGNLAVMQSVNGIDLPFCGGRGDAIDGTGSANLYPWLTMNAMTQSLFQQSDLAFFKHGVKISGLTNHEVVAFMARTHLATWRSYYVELLSEQWNATVSDDPTVVYRAEGGSATRSQADLFLVYDDDLKAVVQELATGSDALFKSVFTAAWSKLMNADRFSGPIANSCDSVFESSSTSGGSSSPSSGLTKVLTCIVSVINNSYDSVG